MSESPLIQLVDVHKRFHDKEILTGLDLSVYRGETVALIGGSGSGKTTLGRILIGLEEPTSGKVLVDGVDVASMNHRQRDELHTRFAMVFQRHALLDSMSVFDNVAFPLRERMHLDEAVVKERVMRALHELGVEGAAGKLPGELSGGMAKRVGIARATVVEPEILVYDEPTSGLDPIASRSVDDLIETMREKHLVTSIVITHDMLTAYDVADRIVLLANGKIAADGTPEELFSRRDPGVAPFARSSGIDFDNLPSRRSRIAAAVLRQAWEGRHPTATPVGPRGIRGLWHASR